jgi:endonuclease/exonuclease/phosphatase (EEP) superfamily protein YafD
MSELGPKRYRIADYAVPVAPKAKASRVWPTFRRTLAIGSWLYAGILLALWIAANWPGADVWPLHLFFFGPRWVLSIPLLLLVGLSIWQRLWWPAAALGLSSIAFCGIWGFNVPWRNLFFVPAVDTSQPTLHVLTCNVQRGDLKIPDLAQLVREERPDVVLLQECNLADPRTVLGEEGWHIESSNEFCLASRHPILDFQELHRPDKNYRIIAVRGRLSWMGAEIPIVGVHLMTPRRGLEPIIESGPGGMARFRDIARVQRFESQLLSQWIQDFPPSIILAGDFNLTAEHPLYNRDWSAYNDAFACTGWGLGQTMFTRNIGLRIDHVLCGASWQPRSCRVGPDVGSAHRPLIAELALCP